MGKKPIILDLDKLVPDQRIVKLAGKEIDVSKIPSSVTLEMASKSEEMQSGSAESFTIVFDMIVKICNATNPNDAITQEWLVQKTSIDQLLALIDFVLSPIKEKAEQGKNQARPVS